MQHATESFLEISRRHLLDADGTAEARTVGQESRQMKALDERLKNMLARRMNDAVVNPPHRVFARELLARGMTANEIWQLVMHDPAFVRVPESFRIAVANAAREMAGQQLLAASRPGRATQRKTSA